MEGQNVSLSLGTIFFVVEPIGSIERESRSRPPLLPSAGDMESSGQNGKSRAEEGTGTDRRGTSALHFSALLSTLYSDLPLVCAGQPASCYRVPMFRRTRFHFSSSPSEKGRKKEKEREKEVFTLE